MDGWPHHQGIHHPIGTHDQNIRGEIDWDRVIIGEKRARPTRIVSFRDIRHLDPIEEKSLCSRGHCEQDDDVCQQGNACATAIRDTSLEDGEERTGGKGGMDAKEEVAEEGTLEPRLFLSNGAV